jgi:uncharacterized membrane protein
VTIDPSYLLPAWAPNLHPIVVHFPIAWLTAALIVDLVSFVLPRAAWAATMAGILYPTGAASAWVAYLSGRQGAANVLIPGMAHALVLDHWNWALATTICFTGVAAGRLIFIFLRKPPPFWTRAVLTVGGLAGMLLLFQTGERGARLVYEFGVGVSIPGARR